MSKTYEFNIPIHGIGIGYVEAENIDEALEIIRNEKPEFFHRDFEAVDYDDIVISSVEK